MACFYNRSALHFSRIVNLGSALVCFAPFVFHKQNKKLHMLCALFSVLLHSIVLSSIPSYRRPVSARNRPSGWLRMRTTRLLTNHPKHNTSGDIWDAVVYQMFEAPYAVGNRFAVAVSTVIKRSFVLYFCWFFCRSFLLLFCCRCKNESTTNTHTHEFVREHTFYRAISFLVARYGSRTINRNLFSHHAT